MGAHVHQEEHAEGQADAAAASEIRAAAAMPAALSIGSILALQRSAGNQAVSRMISSGAPAGVYRDLLDDVGNAVGDALGVRTDEERLDAEEELEEFRSQTFAPLVNHHPTSGRGQFDVAGDMRAGTMTITLKIAYDFIDGDASKVAAGYRPEELTWAPEEMEAWKARYQADVGAAWSARFAARSTKPHWTAMLVDTTVQIVEDAGAPHFTLTVEKYPPDAELVGSSICPPGTHHDAATGDCAPNAAGDVTGTGVMDSNDLRPEQKLDGTNPQAAIPFREGSAALNASGTAAIAPVITAVAGVAGAHVEITGRASTTHRAGQTPDEGAISNMDLARARTAAVQAALIAGGATTDQILVRNQGEAGASEGTEWCRVDAQVGTQATQSPALHETGHMLGNADEYPAGAATAGSAVSPRYQAMITAQTGDVVTRAEDESVMSMGSTVQRWNYAAFLEALKALTGDDDWAL